MDVPVLAGVLKMLLSFGVRTGFSGVVVAPRGVSKERRDGGEPCGVGMSGELTTFLPCMDAGGKVTDARFGCGVPPDRPLEPHAEHQWCRAPKRWANALGLV